MGWEVTIPLALGVGMFDLQENGPLLKNNGFFMQILECNEDIKKCILDCWQEDPVQRPDFRNIRTSLRALQAGL